MTHIELVVKRSTDDTAMVSFASRNLVAGVQELAQALPALIVDNHEVLGMYGNESKDHVLVETRFIGEAVNAPDLWIKADLWSEPFYGDVFKEMKVPQHLRDIVVDWYEKANGYQCPDYIRVSMQRVSESFRKRSQIRRPEPNRNV